MTLTITLPHPAKELHPNARPHFMVRARAKKAARQEAYYAAIAALRDAILYDGEPISFAPTRYVLCWYYWGHMPDEDNCLAACKAYLDGCADAFEVNDKTLSCAGMDRVHEKNKRIDLIFYGEKD